MATMQVTGRRLAEIANALALLKQRRVELGVDLRVTIWWAQLQTAVSAYNDVARKLDEREARVGLLSDLEERIAEVVRLQEDRQALDRELYDVPAPKRRLVYDDLPKAFVGPGGPENSVARSAIAAALHPEYLDLPPEEPDV